ncbi:MAG: alpha amylase C-terminal domain-containing protein [Proteobacteria bacterium]|nr:alpha amylase C-terminal domain-containing protein [Pseudomonadota bacterium]MBU4472106.1 alpha amylase C-terminal domain-containing protein [Pseudomonadota bacterium]
MKRCSNGPSSPDGIKMKKKTVSVPLVENDPYLGAYETMTLKRMEKITRARTRLAGGTLSLADFASGHEYFGLHFANDQWIFREWAPNATAVFVVGNMNHWLEDTSFALHKDEKTGVWEGHFSSNTLNHGDLYRLKVHWPGGEGDRIPAYARRVVQDPFSLIFNAQVWKPEFPFGWENDLTLLDSGPPFIYEAHVGMAQEEGKIGTYEEFTRHILPRIKKAGYNTLQLMAIQEHPYYGSFGYQVSNFFAPSSRFGTPEELKALIDAAHGLGLRVIMDIVHSHSVKNETEGLSRFDGTLYQYFHHGDRGNHEAWDSRCFDYGKIQVLHFLLSNCRYWLDEFHFDGFRFDGITSMLYSHHGLGKAFTGYDDYFDETVDEEALTYLALANSVIHEIKPGALTIAEDISGMPGLACPLENGGYGFDFRFAMGVSDYWIKLIKDFKDEDWPMGQLWYELNNRRHDEKTISYSESHDQSLVGDQSIFFRLGGVHVYHHMGLSDPNVMIDRAVALHKLIRMITFMSAGNGYLNFMGNEFGHPEWIDFPRQGNHWSHHYARRQWSLVEDKSLKYQCLNLFDRDMIQLAKKHHVLDHPGNDLLHNHWEDKVIAFLRAGLVFVFNFHPTASYTDYGVNTPSGKYRMIFNSDDPIYGGHNRLFPGQEHFTLSHKKKAEKTGHHFLSLYLPTRTVLVLKAVQ